MFFNTLEGLENLSSSSSPEPDEGTYRVSREISWEYMKYMKYVMLINIPVNINQPMSTCVY